MSNSTKIEEANKNTPEVLGGKRAQIFIILCMLVYFTSYITRINYGAAITELVPSLNITKQQAGLVSTAAFFTYGAGQVFSGILGDKIKPRGQVAFGLFGTSLCNILMMISADIEIMTVIWAINGLFQAMFWPPLVRIMAENLNAVDYSNACVTVSVGASLGTIAVYLATPIIIALGGWKPVFVVSAACGVLMALGWIFTTFKLFGSTKEHHARDLHEHSHAHHAKKVKANTPPPAHRFGRKEITIISITCTAVALQGILRDGVTTWMPTFISEKFDLSSEISILSGIILPIFSIMSYSVATALLKKFNNELTTAMIFFASGAVSALVLRLFAFGESSGLIMAGFSVLMIALLTGSMHGVNLMLTSRFASYFKKYGRISTVSGVVNAFTYVGSAASVYCFAAISDNYGWDVTVIFWIGVSLAGALLCASICRFWAKFKREG